MQATGQVFVRQILTNYFSRISEIPLFDQKKAKNFDVAIDQSFFQKRVTVSVGYFWNRFRQLITTVFDPVGCAPFSPFGFCAQNFGSAKTQGWEANTKIGSRGGPTVF